MENKYILVKDLKVYKLAKELSRIAWDVYEKLNWEEKKIFGIQFVESVDSIGANIVEGYNRFHYLDKIKFYYNSRASLSEANDHWIDLIYERKKTSKEIYEKFEALSKQLSIKLNNFISSTYRAKEREKHA